MANPIAMLKAMINALFDDQEQGSYTVLPAPAASGLVTPATVTAGNAWANGTTVQVDDGTNVTEDMWCDGVYILNSATVGTSAEIDIGVGASGSENWQGTVAWKAPAGTAAQQAIFIPLAVPIFIPKSSRVATRARGSAATAFDIVLQTRTGMKTA